MYFTGAFFCVNMVLITLSSFLSATVINLYMRTDKKNKVPVWLRKVSPPYCFPFNPLKPSVVIWVTLRMFSDIKA